MPTSKINKDAREGKGTKKTLEKKWDKAKDAAGDKNGKQDWPLTMHIYKKMTHQAAVELNAANRIKAFDELTAAWFDSLDRDTLKEMIKEVQEEIKKAANPSQKAKLKQKLAELKNAMKN